MKSSKFKILLSSLLFYSLTNAATLVEYNFEDQDLVADTVLTGITAGDITETITGTAPTSSFSNTYNNGASAAVEGGGSFSGYYRYYSVDPTSSETEFTIDGGGAEVTFESFAFALETRRNSNYTITYTIAGGGTGSTNGSVLGAGTDGATINWDFGDFSTTQIVTFTIDVVDTASTTDSWTAIDTIVVTGSVVPEPSSLALLMLGLMSVALYRRK